MKIANSALIKIIKVICFAALFVYLFIHISYVFRDDLAHTRAHMAGFYAEEKNSLDVVILGTSSTFSAFMPMELWGESGVTGYTLTTNTQLEESIPYTIREMKKYQSPKLLVIDTAPFIYKHMSELSVKGNDDDIKAFDQESGDDVLRFNVDGFKYSKNRIDLINHVVPGDKLYYYLDLLYYHASYHPKLDYWNNEKHSVEKGYSNLHPEYSYKWEDEAEDIIPENGYLEEEISAISMDEASVENWNKLLNELENYDGEVLFVIGPVFRINDDWANRIAAMRNAVNESGYPLLDMSSDSEKRDMNIQPDEDYSLDQMHYNSLSAVKITHRLGQYIDENYGLTDRRSEPDDKITKEWAADYNEWEPLLGEMQEESREQREEFYRRNEGIK